MGALLDWRFHDRLSLEASFVVRASGQTDATVAPNIPTTSESVSAYSWEVPLLPKRRAARIGSANFAIGAGPSMLRGSNGEWTSTSSNSLEEHVQSRRIFHFWIGDRSDGKRRSRKPAKCDFVRSFDIAGSSVRCMTLAR
jgi:hypothetical protein